MNKINISFMTEDAYETLKSNVESLTKYLQEGRPDSSWLENIYDGQLFEEKKYKIPDFELLLSDDGDYKKVDYQNSIILYESLKDLPRYILTDQRFWLWLNFTKGYKAALQAMSIRNSSTVNSHWLFKDGKRRGLFFGVLSRCFLRTALTVDERLDDKYELTKFVVSNPERFRNLTWRANSSEKHIVLATLRAEKDICEKYGDDVKNSVYPELAKALSLFGSVRLIDVVSEEDIYNFVYSKMEQLVRISNSEK